MLNDLRVNERIDIFGKRSMRPKIRLRLVPPLNTVCTVPVVPSFRAIERSNTQNSSIAPKVLI